MTSRPPERDFVEMRLQNFASACAALRRQRLARKTAFVFAAPDRPREAAVEAAEDGPADVRAQEHAAESWIDADLVLVHGIGELLVGPAAGHIAQVAHADVCHIDGNRRLRRIGVGARQHHAVALAVVVRHRRVARGGPHRPRHQPQVDRVGDVGRLGDVRDHRFGHRPAEQRLISPQRIEAELAAARIARVGSERHVAQAETAAAATGTGRRSECCNAPRRSRVGASRRYAPPR